MRFYDEELADLILDLHCEVFDAQANGCEADAEWFLERLIRAEALATRGNVTGAEFDSVNY